MLAGTDVSGGPESGNHKFMAIAIGANEGIEAVAGRPGPKPARMSRVVGRGARHATIDRAEFDGRSRTGLCPRLEKRRIFSDRGRLRQGGGHAGNKKMSRTHRGLAWNTVRDPAEEFLRPHNYEAHRPGFQCDCDCRGFARDRGRGLASPGAAHALADILAWGNSHGLEPKGAICLDLSDRLEEQTVGHFRQDLASTSALGHSLTQCVRPRGSYARLTRGRHCRI